MPPLLQEPSSRYKQSKNLKQIEVAQVEELASPTQLKFSKRKDTTQSITFSSVAENSQKDLPKLKTYSCKDRLNLKDLRSFY